MSAKRHFLTKAQYDALSNDDDWHISELTMPTVHATPGVQRKDDIIGVFISGDANATKILNGMEAVMGMDVIVYEHSPKVAKGEGHINVYHYVVTKTGRLDFPYILHGPFTREALQAHWPPDLDLSPY